MMILIFLAMTLALGLALVGPQGLALAVLLACLALSSGLFLFEVHSPQDGFSMPWLSTEADGPGTGRGRPGDGPVAGPPVMPGRPA